MSTRENAATLRERILSLAEEYAELVHFPQPFQANVSSVPVSGKVLGRREMRYLVDSALDFWLTTGRFNDQFEAELKRIVGVMNVLTTNSGSSANLLATPALTSHLLGKRAMKPGDEVITCATGFPTTINPTLQNGLIPTFLDVELGTYNIDVSRLEEALSAKTRAIMIAHTLGNPFDLDAVMSFARKHDLFVIEDCCDALGATYRGKQVGTFGDLGTLSFYPAHQITMGEGGAVLVNRMIYKRVIESIRDWGRDCYCAPGKDNTCNRRFSWKLGELPQGYDHKYTYSHLGYNLKISDMQAAVGLAQLAQLEHFVAARRRNWQLLRYGMRDLEDVFLLPHATEHAEPSWFGFCLTLREDTPISRDELIRRLNEGKVATRFLFGGNLLRQPYMTGRNYRVIGPLSNSDIVTERTFWIGVFPGLTEDHINYTVDLIHRIVRGTRRQGPQIA